MARIATATLYRICVNAVHSSSGGMCSAFSGTTLVSPGSIGAFDVRNQREPSFGTTLAVSSHHADAAVIGASGLAAAHSDAVGARQARTVQVRGQRLHFTDYGYLLLEPGHDKLVAVAQNYVWASSD